MLAFQILLFSDLFGSSPTVLRLSHFMSTLFNETSLQLNLHRMMVSCRLLDTMNNKSEASFSKLTDVIEVVYGDFVVTRLDEVDHRRVVG